MNFTNIEDILNSEESVLQVPVGYSMWPMLMNRQDQIVIEKVTGSLKKYDVVLYKSETGKYILHRIIKITGAGYVIRGDNCYKKEYDVTDDKIKGVLKGFYKGNRYIDCEKSLGYRFYIIFWRLIYPVRFVIRWPYRGLKKLFGRKDR